MTNQVEVVTGLVEQINAKQTGIKVNGEWLNISQYRALPELPTPGQRVDVHIERTDRAAWIQSLEILDEGQTRQLPVQERRGGTGRPQTDPREIRRLACLKAAATFAAGKCLGGSSEVKTTDVLKVAEAFERWVLEA
jgi:hypothetical protein